MKGIIISLLLGAIALTVAAQQSTSEKKDSMQADALSFRCQIEGQDITLPCRWSDLEQLGWNFANMEDGEETVMPTSNLILLDDTYVQVLSPNKREAKVLFCNLSGKEATRKEAMVYGVVYVCSVSQIIAYDFKTESGIIGGKSKESNVVDAYGKAKLEEYYYLHKNLQYSETKSDNEFTVVVADHSTDSIFQGTVIGFVATANKKLARLITQGGYSISDEQATAIRERYFYEQNIAGYTKKLQRAQADSSISESIPHTKWALAMNYYHLGDYSAAFGWMLQSAQTGYDEAQFGVGSMYFHGDGVDLNDKAGVSWYEKAAEQGNVLAMSALAFYYCTGGYKTEIEHKKAFEWSLKAAQGGNEALYVRMGDYYRDGIDGVKRNDKQAFFWYEKAAESGNKIGIYNLSYMYYCGLGVKRNYTKSFELLLKSDTTQHYVQQALGDHYYYGRGVKKDIDKALIHFNNFIKFTEGDFDGNDDIEIPRLLTKELEEAQKIVKKHQK